MHSKIDALEKLGRYLGMFKGKTEISGSLGIRRAEDLTDDELAAIIAKGG